MERVKKIFEICKKFLEVNFGKTLSYLKKNSKFYLNKKVIIVFSGILFIVLFFLPIYSSAYQIKFTKKSPIEINNAKFKTVYFGEFTKDSHIYNISSNKSFLLHVDVFVPDISWQKKDISIKIIKNNEMGNPIIYFNSSEFRWVEYFDSLLKQNYWQGPSFEKKVESGNYQVIVSSSSNDSKYFVRFEGKNYFNFWQMAKINKDVSKINKDVYKNSSANFIFSFFGFVYIFLLFLISFSFWFFLKFLAKRKKTLNIENPKTQKDKTYFMFAGVFCVVISLVYLWSPFLIFISGIFFCEVIFPLKSKTQ